MALPSNPCRVMVASPQALFAPAVIRTFFKGFPSCAPMNAEGQPTSTPQLDARNGTHRMPACMNSAGQMPVEPVMGQEAPPRAKITRSTSGVNAPSLFSITTRPCPPRPVKACPVRMDTPCSSNRFRTPSSTSMGLMPFTGNTRPLVPMKVSTPLSASHVRSSRGPKARSAPSRKPGGE